MIRRLTKIFERLFEALETIFPRKPLQPRSPEEMLAIQATVRVLGRTALPHSYLDLRVGERFISETRGQSLDVFVKGIFVVDGSQVQVESTCGMIEQDGNLFPILIRVQSQKTKGQPPNNTVMSCTGRDWQDMLIPM